MRAYNFKDLTGQRFNRRVVLKFVGIKTFGSPRAKQSIWLTRCDCGTEAEVTAGSLRGGKSCGCLSREISGRSRRLAPGRSGRNSLLLSYKDSAAKRNFEWKLSDDEFDLITKQNCFYCGVPPSQKSISTKSHSTTLEHRTYIYSGIDRVDNSRGYESDNVVSCCKICNRAKDIMTQEDFIAWAKRVVKHNELER
jgi:hypothetical protein